MAKREKTPALCSTEKALGLVPKAAASKSAEASANLRPRWSLVYPRPNSQLRSRCPWAGRDAVDVDDSNNKKEKICNSNIFIFC